MTTIYVYSGAGTCKSFLPFLTAIFDKITFIDNFDFLAKNEHRPRDVIFIGGGRGKYMLDNLSKRSIGILKDSIRDHKIRYVGICCGAYLASKELIFDGTNHDTIGMCDITSTGPYYTPFIFGPIESISSAKSKIYDYSIDNSTIIMNRINGSNAFAYLSGGGWFSNVTGDFTTLSYYENSCLPNTIKNDQMFLSHLHIEHPDTDKQFVRLLLDFVYG